MQRLFFPSSLVLIFSQILSWSFMDSVSNVVVSKKVVLVWNAFPPILCWNIEPPSPSMRFFSSKSIGSKIDSSVSGKLNDVWWLHDLATSEDLSDRIGTHRTFCLWKFLLWTKYEKIMTYSTHCLWVLAIRGLFRVFTWPCRTITKISKVYLEYWEWYFKVWCELSFVYVELHCVHSR